MTNFRRAAPAATQRGFTLIELLIVVAIVGILAAVAIPRFIDASTTAKEGALKGAAGAVASAAATNYALRKGGNTTNTIAITSCAPTGGWTPIVQIPDDMVISASTATGAVAPADGVVGDCSITYTGTGTHPTYSFKVVGVN